MKRKQITDFFSPIRSIKLSSSSETPSPAPRPIPKPVSTLPSAINLIMSTPQQTLKSNFHLTYNGKVNSKHSWSYSFESSPSFTFQSRTHKLKQSSKDPCSINLTFSTSHTGQPVNFYEFTAKPALSPSILKSILHKAVRRQNRRSSIRTSLQMAVNCG
jgi:hypothetical protein